MMIYILSDLSDSDLDKLGLCTLSQCKFCVGQIFEFEEAWLLLKLDMELERIEHLSELLRQIHNQKSRNNI